jgi:hypothetical protein
MTSGTSSIASRRAMLALLVVSPWTRVLGAEEPVEVVTMEVDRFRITQQERPFAFAQDPSTPSAGVLSVGYALGVGSGIAADRPMPVSMASASGSSTVSAAFGITDRLAPFVTGTFTDGGSSNPAQSYSAGLTWQITNPAAYLRASLSAAGMHEGASGANGATAVLAVSLDQGPLRVAANGRVDKVFATGRDQADYILMLGAAWRLGRSWHLGAEYVGQDLEEAIHPEAEGGARHGLGPTLALDLQDGRYQLALGSAFGLTARSPRALARAVLAFNF